MFNRDKMFWNRKTIKQEKVPGAMVERIAIFFLGRQRRFAECINGLLAPLPARKLKVGLYLFCLLACGYSLLLILRGVIGKVNGAPALHIDQTSVPKHYDQPGDPHSRESEADQELATQLRYFKMYMDSLAVNNRRQYDSVLVERPGLIDTVRVLEEFYQLK
jgi:hypothetical protein